MTQKTVAFLVIGDEILSGRTQDVNVAVLAKRLNDIGARLAEVRVVPDDEDRIVRAIKALCAEFDYVFSSGGIGPTHDDITADCVAKAFGAKIDVREDAKAALVRHYPNGEADLNPARLRMARVPDGASLIENRISGAPGFRLDNLFTLAGVPEIFAAMLDFALPQIEEGEKVTSRSVVIDLPESAVAGALGEVAARFPELAIGSYPQHENGSYYVDVVVKGFDEEKIEQALLEVRKI